METDVIKTDGQTVRTVSVSLCKLDHVEVKGHSGDIVCVCVVRVCPGFVDRFQSNERNDAN